MSSTTGMVMVAFTVRDGEDFDAVAEELEEVVSQAARVWYEGKGKALLTCEPT